MENKNPQTDEDILREAKKDLIKGTFGYVKKVKKFPNKLELVKEVQRMLLTNNYTVYCTKIIGDFMKKEMELNEEWFSKNKLPSFFRNTAGVKND